MTETPSQNRNNKLFLFLIYIITLSLTFTFLIITIVSAAPNSLSTTPANSPHATITWTPTISPTSHYTATASPTTTELLPTITPPNLYMPILSKAIPPTPTPTPTLPPIVNTTEVLYCNSHAKDIPDNDPGGISSNILISGLEYILDLDLRVNIDHTWVGDLSASLRHDDSGSQISLFDRPGIPASSSGCNGDDFEAILDDEITLHVEDRCAVNVPSITGIYKPQQPLYTFIGETLNGTWTLTVEDNFQADTGSLNDWCIAARISNVAATPTPTPIIGSLPSHAKVSNIYGQRQALPLDCESRSAVDWAAHFGVNIDEFDFFYSLPESDNPEEGFVGNVYGAWGQIPPYSYGVHAEPVAETLRDYGLEAYTHRPLSWDELRAEIAAGRPVIVWIVGDLSNGYYEYVVNGVPIYYTSSDGDLMVVARYEHTVIVTGYTSDSVSYLNGSAIYTKSLNQFLESWSVMGNMAITAKP